MTPLKVQQLKHKLKKLSPEAQKRVRKAVKARMALEAFKKKAAQA